MTVCRNAPAFVGIKKYDINKDGTRQIGKFCLGQGIEVAVRVPFDETVNKVIMAGLPITEYSRNGVSCQIEALWESVSK
ncbi:MAG: hypothetical protein JW856_05690 [Dehalococcoidales bacterium]|nr:hypothetical protein [Dehalococcoidales bacterium]